MDDREQGQDSAVTMQQTYLSRLKDNRTRLTAQVAQLDEVIAIMESEPRVAEIIEKLIRERI